MDEITLWGEGAGCFKSLLRKGSKNQHSFWCYQIFSPGLKSSKDCLSLYEWLKINSSPSGSDTRAWACDNPLGCTILGVYTCWPSFVFQSITPGSTSFLCSEGHLLYRVMKPRDAPGRRFRAGSGTRVQARRCQGCGQRRGTRAGGSQPGGSGQRWLHLPEQPGERVGTAAAAGAARSGGRREGGGRGNEPPAAVTEALTFTPAPATAPFRASWSVWETQPPSAPPAHQVTGRWALLPHTSWAE